MMHMQRSTVHHLAEGSSLLRSTCCSHPGTSGPRQSHIPLETSRSRNRAVCCINDSALDWWARQCLSLALCTFYSAAGDACRADIRFDLPCTKEWNRCNGHSLIGAGLSFFSERSDCPVGCAVQVIILSSLLLLAR